MRSRRASASLVLLCSLASSVHAAPNGDYFNPGTMGPNALRPEQAESPWVGDGFLVEAGISVQREAAPGKLGSAPDGVSGTEPFRAELRVLRRAVFEVEGTPTEWWFISAANQQAWSTPHAQGFSKGDVRAGAKFLLLDGRGLVPSFGVRAWTKTTTGKSAADHRFIDAPGYEFDAILGEHLQLRPSFAVELWLTAGFLAWQQAQYGQNDAPAWAATLSFLWTSGFALRLHTEGYRGWQQNDKPIAMGAELDVPLKRALGASPSVSFVLGLTRSVRDPPYTAVTLGVRVGDVAGPATPCR